MDSTFKLAAGKTMEAGGFVFIRATFCAPVRLAEGEREREGERGRARVVSHQSK